MAFLGTFWEVFTNISRFAAHSKLEEHGSKGAFTKIGQPKLDDAKLYQKGEPLGKFDNHIGQPSVRY